MKVILKHGKEKFLRRGYPWVFRNQVARVEGDPERGAAVQICDSAGRTYGQGLYHDTSQITVRFVTTDPDVAIDDHFWRARVERAVALRNRALGDATHVRLICGESDGFPGTIVDRYGDVITWSTLCYGMEQRRDQVLSAVTSMIDARAVVERNDSDLRDKDDLPQRKGLISGELPDEVMIEEEGVRFRVDVVDGPKTGFFIDQRFNRSMMRMFSAEARVLDVFSADGGFGLHAAAAGAKSVHAIDASESAMARLRHNAEINGATERYRFETADALDRLASLAAEGATYDLIILDPPAFAKSKRHRESAKRAYQSININAFRMLEPGGILATSSCSQAVDEAHFQKIVRYAAKSAGVSVRLLARGYQPPDHPVLETMPETAYLKLFVYQVIDDEVPR
ncbi:MAG: class I SAM-dependent rRNA methyltransferase [Rhodothermia bacterium]|nr:class I SAM-dependent rRNA methyltransferase [Rhodothermia bacterium]